MSFKNTFHGQVNNTGKNSDIDTKEIDSVSAGATFEHDGPVIIKNDIGACATVKITNGGLVVKGTVGNGARIKTEGGSGSSSINIIQSNGVTIINGSIVSSNGCVVNGTVIQSGNNTSSTAAKGITLEGSVGKCVTCVSDSDVTLLKAAREDLAIKSGRDVELYDLPEGGIIEAARDVKVEQSIKYGAKVTSARDIECHTIDASTVSAARDVECHTISGKAKVSAGRDIECTTIFGAMKITAGRDIEANSASEDAIINAGRKTKISTRTAKAEAPKPNRFDIF